MSRFTTINGKPVRRKKVYRIEDRLADYKRWWLGKLVRQPYDGAPILGRVASIKVFGPPSGFTCLAELTMDNGKVVNLTGGVNGFRACKWELVVVPEAEPETKKAG